MKNALGTSGTKSRRSDNRRAQELLAEADEILKLADEAQQIATRLRKQGEAKLAQAKALMPLPLWDAANRRH